MVFNNRVKKQKTNLSSMGNGLDVIRCTPCNAGELIPIEYLETLPGSVLQPKVHQYVRMMPMKKPVFGEVYIKTWFFHVPYQNIFDSWADFITGGEQGADATVFPYITTPSSTGFTENSLADYLNIPTGVASKRVDTLKFRAYAEIYNWHFRNHDVQTTKLTVSKAAGSDTTTNVTLQKVNWQSDYFMGKPWTQRGTEVTLPIGSSAGFVQSTVDVLRKTSGTYNKAYQSGTNTISTGDTIQYNSSGNLVGGGNGLSIDPNGAWYVPLDDLDIDLAGASPARISDLRLAFAKQNVFEILMKIGGFYSQYLRGIFGVTPDDARLDMPEYLGMSTSRIMVSEVLQTSESGTTPQGTLTGHGIGSDMVNDIKPYTVREHGMIMGLMSIMPIAFYHQGLEKMDTKRTRWDFFHPQLEGLSLQPVYNKEIYLAGANNDSVFCYQPPYYEYRKRRNTIHGSLRSTLNYWLYASRNFSSEPSFNSTFITCTPPEDIFFAPDEPTYMVESTITYPVALLPISLNAKPAVL